MLTGTYVKSNKIYLYMYVMKYSVSLCFDNDIEKIIAGHGHFEINMTNTMFKLLLEV